MRRNIRARYKSERKRYLRELSDLYQQLPFIPDPHSPSIEIEAQIKDARWYVKVLDSLLLEDEAGRFGVDLREAVGPWFDSHNKRFTWIEEREQTAARQIINEARFKWWKKWIDLLSPALSVVISLLAFALAAIALYLQIAGKLR
jgi:hypothetical protein